MSNIKSLEEMKPKNDTRVFIGIDPGKSGGCGIISIEDGVETHLNFKFPKQIDLLSVGLMATIPRGLSLENVHVLVEHVHAFPKQGAVSTFSFGQNLGHWEGTLHANEFNFTYVNPKEWIYWYGIPKGLEKKKRKRLLLEKAKKLFPNMKITFNVSDAMLIANYCMEMYYRNTAERSCK